MTRMDWSKARQRDRTRGWANQPNRPGTSHYGNPASAGYDASPTCQGTKRDGTPCHGKAQTGHRYCGPHLDQEETAAR